MLGVTLLSRMEAGRESTEERKHHGTAQRARPLPPLCVICNLIKLTFSNISCVKLYLTNNSERAVSLHGAMEVMFRA